VKNQRAKRGILDGIGSVASSLIWLVSKGDLQEMTLHVNAIERGAQLAMNEVKQQGVRLSSLTNVTGQRLRNAMAGVQNNHQLLTTLASHIKGVASTLASSERRLADLVGFDEHYLQILSNTLRCILRYQEHFRTVEVEVSDWLAGTYKLLDGMLSPGMVPVDQLQLVLQKAAIMVAEHWPSFSLNHPEVTFYYSASHHGITFTQSSESI
jgi:hypothetical protein